MRCKLETQDAQGNDATDRAVIPLRLPAGFTISIFAKDLEGPRVLAQDRSGTLLVSLTKAGKVVALPDKDGNGKSAEEVTVVAGLNNPHGLAFRPNDGRRLYVAATEEVVVFDYDTQHRSVRNPKQIAKLPPGGRHFTRSLLFTPSPPERLLISVGSSCDVCEEKDWRYGKILAVNPENKELKTFASGLRNAVFLALEPGTGRIFATEMGRDFLGDDLPPDEINVILEGKDYGWPWCYGKQVHDGQFDKEGAKTSILPTNRTILC